jgi:hypothetical protein
MWLKLTLLKERDSNLQIEEFEEIGFIGYVLELISNKLNNFIFSEKKSKLNYDICWLLFQAGYMRVPNDKILKYKGNNIKKLLIYTKNCANEMYFTKCLMEVC